MPDIINGIWAIGEESSWVIPAHAHMLPRANLDLRASGDAPLSDGDSPVIDLFAAETAALFAWAHYLLKPRLDKVSVLIGRRMKHEVRKRIVEPYLARDEFWWMGFDQSSGYPMNNWNPWCNSNVLACFLLLEEDRQLRVRGVSKVMRSLDRFIESYHEDGGCDEGPGYWHRAAGSLLDCLEQLHAASDGRIDVYDAPLIENMGTYIAKVHIGGNDYVNFADGAARMSAGGSRIYRYGRRIGDEKLAAMGISCFHRSEDRALLNARTMHHKLMNLFLYSELAAHSPDDELYRDVWLKDIQVMCARERVDSTPGFFLAAKGGHNDENHNHNDVGSYIVYCDGEPVFVDVGVEDYTARTFGPERYDIWTMQSNYHNLPSVNGYQQKEGLAFCATDVCYRMDDQTAEFSLDLARAYPVEAGIRYWKRTFRLKRNGSEDGIRIVEECEFLHPTADVTLHFMSVKAPEAENGTVRLPLDATGAVRLTANEAFHIEVERISVTDNKLMKIWGSWLYRTTFRLRKPVGRATWIFTIEREVQP